MMNDKTSERKTSNREKGGQLILERLGNQKIPLSHSSCSFVSERLENKNGFGGDKK